MNLLLFLLAAVCTVNAPRIHTVLPARPEATALATLGAAITTLALAVVAVLANPLLDLVSLSDATFRIATGLVLVATGILAFGGPGPAPEPALAGRRAALVPIAFPTLSTPGLAALTLSASADHGPVVALGGAVLALVTLPAITLAPPAAPSLGRLTDGVARLLAAVLVIAALGLLFDGVFDI